MSYKFCAVILNYNSYGETVECVNALLKMKYDACEIVIVDNGSKNESVSVLKERFSGNGRVHIIVSENNLGFAKGNNLGISYAREKLGADFVYVCNSDTVSPEKLFGEILKAYKRGTGVISPSVYRPDGSFQLPNENSDSITKRLRFSITHLLMGMVLLFVLRKKNEKPVFDVKTAEPDSFGRYVLQGCSYFLTPDYFEHYKGLYPKTFLYWEEINLLYMLNKAGLRSIEIKTTPVIHKGKMSTITDDLQAFKLRNAFKSMLKSLPLYFMSLKRISEKY